jgi:hypothetical protein
VRSPAVGHDGAVAFDRVVVAEARAAEVAAPRVHVKSVVEPRGLDVAHVRFEDERLDPLGAQLRVAAGELVEVRDACDLEPDEVVGVVRDALRVGLGEADANLGREGEAVHRAHSMTVPPDRASAASGAAR